MKPRILEFIKNNPDTWEEKLNEKFIRTNHNGDLVCFKYATEADFSDPLVCEARGIMIDVVQLSVVCWPFDKLQTGTAFDSTGKRKCNTGRKNDNNGRRHFS